MKIIKEDAVWALKSAMADIIMESNRYDVPGEKLETLNMLNENVNFDHFKSVILEAGIKDKAKDLSDKVVKKTKAGYDKAVDVTADTMLGVKDNFQSGSKKLQKAGKKASKYTKEVEASLPMQLSKLPADVKAGFMRILKSAKTKGAKQSILNRIKELSVKGGKSVAEYSKKNTAGVAVAGASIVAAVTGAYYIYKRFLSQAARQCSGLSGAKKTACMKKFKTKAAQAAIQKLNGSKKQFKGDVKKIASIDKHIAKWKGKISNY